MHARRWMAVGCLLSLMLAGCGGASKFTDPPATAPIPLSGNWAFRPSDAGTLTVPGVFPPFIAGNVSVNGTQVSADVMTLPSGCTIAGALDVTLTGTVQKGQIGLTSASWNGIVFTITGTVSSGGESISGTWSAKGGCIDGQSGQFVGNYVPPVTGTWVGTASNLPAGLTGTSTNSPLAGASVTFQLQQSSTPEAYLFPLSGTVTISGTNCGFTHGTLIGPESLLPQAGSSILGDTWTLVAQMDDGQSSLIGAALPVPASSTEWLMVFGASGGACGGAPVQVTLTKQ